MVVSTTTNGVNRVGELGFDSGEGAFKMATTSTEGNRRENYPILVQGGSEEMYYVRHYCLNLGINF